MSVSLIIAYRKRPTHLACFLRWAKLHGYFGNREYKFILVEQDGQPTACKACRKHGIEYVHIESDGVFHKTKLLNIGAKISSSEFVVPFDIDLVPIRDSLKRHLVLAKKYNSALITGYRLLNQKADYFGGAFEQRHLNFCDIAPEDQPSALHKQLVDGEKFGVLPFFQRELLMRIGAWDEKFIGWGAEDQDLIERYTKRIDVLRSSELVYLHLDHGADMRWKNDDLIKKNRDYYYKKRTLNELQDN